MGIYIDKGNMGFREARNGEYIDKSGLITVVNGTLGTEYKFSCLTRARRFGKSMAAKMLYAYYDRSCDSRELFQDLEVAHAPSFEQHLNKYPVIYLDFSSFATSLQKPNIVSLIDAELKKDVREAYPDVAVPRGADLMAYLIRVNAKTGDRFFFIIDEWDALLREATNKVTVDGYVNWLRHMFKEVSASDVFVGVYMTGILPIKKYDTQSALNNFTEYSMVKPGGFARYFGFTKDEVRALAEKHGMDFDDLEKWYDGYQIGPQPSMFNPNSVMQAVREQWCESYWGKTAAYDTLATYIKMNYEGLEDDIIRVLSGQRVKVDTSTFLNDLKEVASRDDVLTVLIHLGYLSYDRVRQECYLPNREVALEMEKAVRKNNWKPVVEAMQRSERLIQSLLRGDAVAVAAGIETVHRQEVSLFKYNDENSMACVISLAFYAARNDFHVHREYQTGDGYADLVLVPRKNVDKPAVVIELKYDNTAETAVSQIKQRHYPEKLQDYSGDILLAGINYDRKTKQHECQIERWEKA
ncbi:MAG: AAA family ATPase [Prevotella sp.]|nr:AAA family ATPase [Prevotella sp.]